MGYREVIMECRWLNESLTNPYCSRQWCWNFCLVQFHWEKYHCREQSKFIHSFMRFWTLFSFYRQKKKFGDDEVIFTDDNASCHRIKSNKYYSSRKTNSMELIRSIHLRIYNRELLKTKRPLLQSWCVKRCFFNKFMF